MWRCHRCRQNHCFPNGFYEELQVLGCESWSHRSVNVPDILSTWSSTDLRDVAWFATVEAETAMSVFLHWVGVVQVHRLGAEGTVAAEGLEKEEEEEEAVAVEVMTGGEQNKDGLVVAAFGWVSWNHLHWLSSREVLRFHSAQVVGMGSSQ